MLFDVFVKLLWNLCQCRVVCGFLFSCGVFLFSKWLNLFDGSVCEIRNFCIWLYFNCCSVVRLVLFFMFLVMMVRFSWLVSVIIVDRVRCRVGLWVQLLISVWLILILVKGVLIRLWIEFRFCLKLFWVRLKFFMCSWQVLVQKLLMCCVVLFFISLKYNLLGVLLWVRVSVSSLLGRFDCFSR